MLQEKYVLMVFESRVQTEVFGSKEIEVTGDWRKLIRRCMAFKLEQILLG